MKASDVLLQLAADFVQQKRYVEAVKCLQPVSESSELPMTKVKARLALAQLLLAHFDNEAEARQQLKQAVSDPENKVATKPLRGTQHPELSTRHAHLQDLELRHTACTGRLLLQCEVADSLGRCHRLTGAVTQEKEAYAAGLQAAKQSASAKEKAVLARWQAYFVFRLAEYAIHNESPEQGLLALEALDSQQSLTPHEQASAVTPPPRACISGPLQPNSFSACAHSSCPGAGAPPALPRLPAAASQPAVGERAAGGGGGDKREPGRSFGADGPDGDPPGGGAAGSPAPAGAPQHPLRQHGSRVGADQEHTAG